MKKMMKRILLFMVLPLSIASFSACRNKQSPGPDGGGPGGPPPGKGNMPPGPPPGGNSTKTTKISATEGDWSFDVITKTEGDKTTVSSTITYYAGKTENIVIVPGVLGGALVTAIAAQAFGHHGEISAVYVPDSVTDIADWAFYDLNEALIISFANPDVLIDEAAFQSSGNAALILPKKTTQTEAGGKTVLSSNTTAVKVTVKNPENAAIAGGNYLNVSSPSGYEISAEKINAIAKSASGKAEDVSTDKSSVTFKGEKYVAVEQKVEIHEKFKDEVSPDEVTKTFRALTAEEATALNKAIAQDDSYKAVKSLFNFEAGYYVNGNKVQLDNNIKAYDVSTAEEVALDEKNGLLPSTGKSYYKYITYRDSDNDGKIETIYYSPVAFNYSYNPVTIKSDNPNLNGLGARDTMNPTYMAFASAVVYASGEKNYLKESALTADTAKDGNTIGASANQERSIIWAHDYAIVEIEEVHATSSSIGNWAKMSYEAALQSYNVEIIMEWGMNALLYATDGGVVKAGKIGGKRSTFFADGDGANGIIAGGAGTRAGTPASPNATAEVYLYNADLTLAGWNNHVADVVYGGYAYLEDIKSVTGKEGSYAVGQGSALANDFGNGVVDVKNFHTTVYGNRSAGIYVIGGGVITAVNSTFISKMDAGVVSASGGTLKLKDTAVTGQIGFRNRGGITAGSTSTFNNVSFVAEKDIDAYVTGNTAKAAVDAWAAASGATALIHYMMSDPKMTIGQLCTNYDIPSGKTKALLKTLGELAGKSYTKKTPLRNSVLDNTYYNYSAGAYTGKTDHADIPYLSTGSTFGGLISAVFEFEQAGETVELNNCTFENKTNRSYNYLVGSEAGSEAVINFNSSDAEGIIWNEGDVDRFVEGRPGKRSSKVAVTFNGSSFTGSFADGSNGLWNVEGLHYIDNSDKDSSLNGNFYGASANWGITASFDKDSIWTVTHDSYLGKLTIADGAKIQTADGKELQMTVDGQETGITAGSFSGQIIITLK